METSIDQIPLKDTVLIYFFDPETGAFLGLDKAFIDIEGSVLNPSNSTVIAPPNITDPGYAPSWNGKEWILVKDYRGKYWNKTTIEIVIISKLGEVPGPELTSVAPPNPIEGYAIVWEENTWIQKENHLGTTIFDIITLQPTTVKNLGPIPEGYTDIVPLCEYPIWNGSTWVVNEELKAKIETAIKAKEDLSIEKAKIVSEVFTSWTDVEKAIDAAKSLDDIKVLLKKTLAIQFLSETGSSIATEKEVIAAKEKAVL